MQFLVVLGVSIASGARSAIRQTDGCFEFAVVGGGEFAFALTTAFGASIICSRCAMFAPAGYAKVFVAEERFRIPTHS